MDVHVLIMTKTGNRNQLAFAKEILCIITVVLRPCVTMFIFYILEFPSEIMAPKKSTPSKKIVDPRRIVVQKKSTTRV
jgi:hypothetical protein